MPAVSASIAAAANAARLRTMLMAALAAQQASKGLGNMNTVQFPGNDQIASPQDVDPQFTNPVVQNPANAGPLRQMIEGIRGQDFSSFGRMDNPQLTPEPLSTQIPQQTAPRLDVVRQGDKEEGASFESQREVVNEAAAGLHKQVVDIERKAIERQGGGAEIILRGLEPMVTVSDLRSMLRNVVANTDFPPINNKPFRVFAKQKLNKDKKDLAFIQGIIEDYLQSPNIEESK